MMALRCLSQSQNENTIAKSKTQHQITKHNRKQENMTAKQKHNRIQKTKLQKEKT